MVVPPFPTSSGKKACTFKTKILCQACSNRPAGGQALPLVLISAPDISVVNRKRAFNEVFFKTFTFGPVQL